MAVLVLVLYRRGHMYRSPMQTHDAQKHSDVLICRQAPLDPRCTSLRVFL